MYTLTLIKYNNLQLCTLIMLAKQQTVTFAQINWKNILRKNKKQSTDHV